MTLTGSECILQNDLILALIALYPDTEKHRLLKQDFLFQQDGASPQDAAAVR